MNFLLRFAAMFGPNRRNAASDSTDKNSDPTFDVQRSNAIMQRAYSDVEASLSTFMEHALEDDLSIVNTMIKVALHAPRPDEPDHDEVIWITPFRKLPNDEWAGVLLNEPRFLPDLHSGDMINFETAQIVDWAWIDADGVFYGSYTQRALAEIGEVSPDDMPPLSRNPIPDGW